MTLTNATPAQRHAITTDHNDVTALAGPGSGKTATLVARIERLICDTQIPPSEIVVLTFTNAAAAELERRLLSAKKAAADLDSASEDPEPWALGHLGTLHSFALRMLKEHGSAFGYGDRVSIISPESAVDLLASKAKSLGCKVPLKKLLELKQAGRPNLDRFSLPATVVASYFDDMRAAGIVDYDGLLMELDNLLKLEPFTFALGARFAYLFVDEVQDSAPSDWSIYRALPMMAKCYAGDPDQAIYSFRGGRVAEMLLHAHAASTEVVKLEENFRSNEEITAAAQRLIEHNLRRLDKRTISVRGPGGSVTIHPPFENEGEEIAAVARLIRECESSEVAVLARTNAIADGFRKGLAPLGISVVEMKRTKLPPDWARARAFVELLVNPENDALAFFYSIARLENEGVNPKDAREWAHKARREAAAVGRSLNLNRLRFTAIANPEHAIEALAVEKISRESRAIIAERFRELPNGSTTLDLALALADVREYTKEDDGPGVRVMTIHAAKGREFDAVFLVGFEDEACPGRAAKAGAEDIEEERRLAYVAITRAKRELHVTCARTRPSEWLGVQIRTPSRFIAELAPLTPCQETGR
jgi:DNA helicase-2/ATP-dependent DNA helicase PcrA